MKFREFYRSAIFFLSLGCHLAHADLLPENILSEPEFTSRGDGILGWEGGGFVGGNAATGKNYGNSAKAVTEEGKNFVRLTCDHQFANFALSPDDRLPLLPEWTALSASALVRVNAFMKNDAWGGFNLWLKFYDFDGKEIEGLNDTFVRISQNQSWKSEQKTIDIPKGATEVAIQLHWLAAGGVADVTNLVLKPQ